MAQEIAINEKLSTLVALPIQTYDSIVQLPDNIRVVSDVVIKPLSDNSFYIIGQNDGNTNENVVQLLNNANNNSVPLMLFNIPIESQINQNLEENNTPDNLDVIIEQTNDNIKPISVYRCTKCDEEFKKFTLYRKHILWHNNVKKFKCDQCSISYNNEENLKIHTAVHCEGKPTCPICKISFQRLASLKSHLLLHQIEELYKCEECLSEFEREDELSKHLQIHLTSPKDCDSLICSYCHVRFTDPNSYKEHLTHHVKIKKMIVSGRRTRKTHNTREYNHCCNVCQKSFSKASLLERHSRVHSGEKPFICEYCKRGFNQKGALQIHLTKHTGIKPYRCTLCSAEFYQKGNLRVHVEKTHTAPSPGIKTYKCSHCACIFKKIASLNVHITKAHANNQNQPNDMIELTNKLKSIEQFYTDDDNNKQIVIESNDNNNYNYVRVAESFSDGTTRRYLVKQKRTNDSRIYICNYCSKEFKKPSDLIRHTRVHTRERPFLCKYCNISFALKSTLLSHLKTHTGKCHYSCPICMKKFSTARALNIHLRTHPDKMTQSLKCNPCNKWFSSVQKMLAHKEKYHKKEETLTNQSKIEQNISIELSDTRIQTETEQLCKEQYECQMCKMKFDKLFNLKQHLNTHSTDKNYKCGDCSKSFSTTDALKEHKLSSHSNPKSYLCSDCGKKFTSLSLLKRHKLNRNHPFMCSYCDKSYCNLLSYRRHISIHKNGGNFDENNKNLSIIDPDSMINSDNLSTNNDSNSELNNRQNIENQTNPVLDQQQLYQLIPNQIQIVSNNSNDNKGKEQVQILINCEDLQFTDNGSLYTKNDEATEATFFNHLDFQDGNVFNIDNLNHDFEQILNTTPNQLINNNIEDNNKELLNNSVDDGFTATTTTTDPPPTNVIVDPSLTIFNNNLEQDLNNSNINDDKVDNVVIKKSTNDNKRKYTCPYCKRTITNKSTYSKHIDNHIKRKKTEPLLHICSYCNKTFKKHSDLIRHIRTHTGERPFACDKCDKSFSLKSTLLSHQRTHNPINSKKILCNVCNSSFTSKSSLRVHMSLHTGIKPYECTYCSMKFRTLSHRKYHEASQHSNINNNNNNKINNNNNNNNNKNIDQNLLENGDLLCDNQQDQITLEISTSNQQLDENNDNILVVQESLQLPTLINDNLNLNETVQLESNILQQWSSNLLLQDPLLQSSSLIQLDDGTLLNIKTINNDIDLVNNQNLIENQSIDQPQQLEQQQQQEQQKQIETVNGKPRTLKCDICDKMYASKDVLRRHRKNHGVNKKFPCNKCDKGFDTEEALEKHNKLHTGYRPFTCMYCNNSFSKQQSLSAHMKRIHKISDNFWKDDFFFTLPS